jgi:hypothetical protein
MAVASLSEDHLPNYFFGHILSRSNTTMTLPPLPRRALADVLLNSFGSSVYQQTAGSLSVPDHTSQIRSESVKSHFPYPTLLTVFPSIRHKITR